MFSVKEARVDPPVSSSDHCTVSIDVLFRLKKQKAYTGRVWEFANAHFDDYRNSLSTLNLAECIDVNIEESCDRLTKSLLDAAHQCIPSKIVTIRSNDKPWFNNYLRRLLRTKNHAHNTAKESNNFEDWAMFRRHRNFYNEEVKRIKSEFREKCLKSLAAKGTENPKKWWSILKNIWNNHKDIIIPSINDGSETATSDVDKANASNSFFLKAAQVDDSNVQLPLEDIPAHCLDTITITETEVSDHLDALNINKAYGPDDISPRFLKEGGQTLCASSN